MGILDLLKRSRTADPDEAVLAQLKKAGSNLAKVHPVEFFLYLPDQPRAELAADQIRGKGFEVQVNPAAKGESWLCFATKEIVPELTALQEIRRDFDSLTESLGGDYDGWGTPAVD